MFPTFGLDACQTQHETGGWHLPTDWKHEWIKTAHHSVFCIFVYHSYPVSPFSLAFLIILLPSLLSANFSFSVYFRFFLFFFICILSTFTFVLPEQFCPCFYFTCSVYRYRSIYFRCNLCITYIFPCIYVNSLYN
jgi:hypothetical protein